MEFQIGQVKVKLGLSQIMSKMVDIQMSATIGNRVVAVATSIDWLGEIEVKLNAIVSEVGDENHAP